MISCSPGTGLSRAGSSCSRGSCWPGTGLSRAGSSCDRGSGSPRRRGRRLVGRVVAAARAPAAAAARHREWQRQRHRGGVSISPVDGARTASCGGGWRPSAEREESFAPPPRHLRLVPTGIFARHVRARLVVVRLVSPPSSHSWWLEPLRSRNPASCAVQNAPVQYRGCVGHPHTPSVHPAFRVWSEIRQERGVKAGRLGRGC